MQWPETYPVYLIEETYESMRPGCTLYRVWEENYPRCEMLGATPTGEQVSWGGETLDVWEWDGQLYGLVREV